MGRRAAGEQQQRTRGSTGESSCGSMHGLVLQLFRMGVGVVFAAVSSSCRGSASQLASQLAHIMWPPPPTLGHHNFSAPTLPCMLHARNDCRRHLDVLRTISNERRRCCRCRCIHSPCSLCN